LLCIMVNCVFLSMYDPLDLDSPRNYIISISEIVFQVIFTLEMLLKVFAKGLILHRFSYMRDYWNILDCVIVFTGFLTFFNLGNNLSVLRAVRLLRPLRAISSLEDMRIIIDAFLKSLPMLSNSIVLFVFLLLMYAIIGVQLFKGKLRNRCYSDIDMELWNANYLCGPDGGRDCPDDFSCLPWYDNVNSGWVSFDNVFWSALNLFSGVSGEEWAFTMYFLSATMARIIPNIFMISFMLIGALFVLNLNLAIISDNFSMQLGAQHAKRQRMREEQRMQRELDTMAIAEGFVQELTIKEDGKPPVQTLTMTKKSSIPRIQNGASSFSDLSSTSLTVLQKLRTWRKAIFSIEKTKRRINRLYDVCANCLDAAPYQRKIRYAVAKFMNSRLVVGFFIFLTILNTISLGVDYYQISEGLSDALGYFNYVFIAFFTFEAVIKVYSFGLRRFLSDGFNVLDAFIVTISFVEIALGSSTGFTVLRTFRLLRVLKLARFSENIQKLLRILLKSVTSAFMITIVLIILIFVSALLGMQLFGGKFGPTFDNGQKPRVHWDTFDMALISSFIIIASEDWPLIQYETMSATGVMSFLYFCALFTVGNYIVLNLFVALLLSQFENDEGEEQIVGNDKVKRSFSLRSSLEGVVCFWRRRVRYIPQVFETKFVNTITDNQRKFAASVDQHKLEKDRKVAVEMENAFDEPTKHRKHRGFLMDRLVGDYSLFVLGDNVVRRILRRIVTHSIFEAVILVLIAISVLTLVLDDPFAPPDTMLMRLLEWTNLILTIIFVLECALKIVAMGFILMEGAYLRDPWNVLDIFIVVVSLTSYMFSGANLQFLRTLRLLRALRPLRLVNRFKSLKIVLDALFWSVPSILNVIVVSILVFIIFGIMGVQLMKGTFYECTFPKWSSMALCEADGHEWRSLTIYNFDNLFNAILTLFTMQTFEGWTTVLMMGIDSTEPGWVGVPENRTYIALYFICYIVVDVFFISNLFVGVLIDQYYNMKTIKNFHGLLTARQKQWIDIQRVLFDAKPRFKPKPPSVRQYEFSPNGNWAYYKVYCSLRIPVPMIGFHVIFRPIIFCRRILFYVVTSAAFEFFIMAIILLNMFSMAMDHYQINPTFSLTLTILNYFWTAIFVTEAVLKLGGLGLVQYFKDWWNCFDFGVTALGAIGIISSFIWSSVPGFLTVFRLLRILRLFRLVRVARGIQQLLKTLFLSLPSMFNVGSLLCLLYFIYALIGMRLFPRVAYSKYSVERDDGFNADVHFRDLWTSILTMIRVSGGEDWPTIMEAAMYEKAPYCSQKIGDCGSFLLSPLFFCSFVLFASFILLNLFTAVILENFSSVISSDGSVLNETYIRHYQKCWQRYAIPNEPLFVRAADLPYLVVDLGPPLGFQPTERHYSREMRNLMRSLASMNHHEGDKLHFQEVLLRLAQYKFGVDLPLKMREKFELRWDRTFPRAVEDPPYTIQQIYAAMKLQQQWRKTVLMRKLKETEQGPFFQNAHDFEDDSAFSNLESFSEDSYNPDVENESLFSSGSSIELAEYIKENTVELGENGTATPRREIADVKLHDSRANTIDNLQLSANLSRILIESDDDQDIASNRTSRGDAEL